MSTPEFDLEVIAAARVMALRVTGESWDSLNPHRQRAVLSDVAAVCRAFTEALPVVDPVVPNHDSVIAQMKADPEQAVRAYRDVWNWWRQAVVERDELRAALAGIEENAK